MRLLFIDNDKPLLHSLLPGLKKEGFLVDVAHDRGKGNDLAHSMDYDLVIVDATVCRDGLELLKTWRHHGLMAHVLILTAPGADNIVAGLDAGADDCLTKPVQREVLLAHVRALHRRLHEVKDPILRVHDLEIDTAAHAVRRGGRPINLTPREYSLLQFLAFNRGKLVTRSMIWDHLYGKEEECSSNVVDVYIRYLRMKIDKGFQTPLILTHWGKGYMLRNEDGCLEVNVPQGGSRSLPFVKAMIGQFR